MKRISIGSPVVEWVARQTNEFGNFGCAVGIGLEEYAGYWKMIAGVAYAEWNGVNIVCHIASDKSRRWMTRQYLWTIFDYPFNQLGARVITVQIGEGNIASRNLAEHFGFTLDAKLDDRHPTGDLLIYSMRKPQCRWLGLEKVSHEERLAA